MIKINFKQFIRDRIWFGWVFVGPGWYGICVLPGEKEYSNWGIYKNPL